MELPENLKTAIQNYLSGNATEAEKQLVNDWYYSFSDDSVAIGIEIPADVQDLKELVNQRIKSRLSNTLQIPMATETIVVPMWKKVARASSVAAVLLLIAAGGWLYFTNKPSKELANVQNSSPYKNDIAAPVSNKATLTIDGGNPIVLSDLNNGSLEKAGVAGAFKTGENKLSYDGNATVVVYQTLSNPLGSKPQELSLPDGSMVWLNAGSSIRYPSKFTGAERSVSMTGEAYFEVKHDASQPFRVTAGSQVIEDLGTAFNVKAYKDEPVIKTTLVEGIVKIGNVTLKPGEQLNGSKVITANIAQEIAWKNGQFYFSHNTVESILQQAMRWYDIEVEYQGKVNETFTVNVDRDLPISKLLQYMEKSGGVHFEIEGKKVIVKP